MTIKTKEDKSFKIINSMIWQVLNDELGEYLVAKAGLELSVGDIQTIK